MFSVESLALLCCCVYNTVYSGKILLIGRARWVPKIIALDMQCLTRSLFCDPEWKPAYFTCVSSPVLKERRVERWISNTLSSSVSEGEHSLFPPLPLLLSLAGPAATAAASGTTFRLRWFLGPSSAAPSSARAGGRRRAGFSKLLLVDGEAE